MIQAGAGAGGAGDGERETDLRCIFEGEPVRVVKETEPSMSPGVFTSGAASPF